MSGAFQGILPPSSHFIYRAAGAGAGAFDAARVSVESGEAAKAAKAAEADAHNKAAEVNGDLVRAVSAAAPAAAPAPAPAAR